ncbi:MAG: hypothetical protein WC959_01025 [Kiritimatiellales bacterium]
MNKKTLKKRIPALFALFIIAGCKTSEEPQPLSWRQQQEFTARTRDPRIYNIGIYQTPGGGTEYRGGSRLHLKQIEALPMQAEKPYRTVINIRTGIGREYPVLLDFTENKNWFTFELAKKIGAQAIGERQARLEKRPDDDIASCVSVVKSLRLNQLYIEDPVLHVRMASGPLGAQARGIKKPAPEGVIGWATLSKFEQIRLDYSTGKIILMTTEEYISNPDLVVFSLPIVKSIGACAVRGNVDGKDRFVLIDPAGDFEVSSDSAAMIQTIRLGEFEIAKPAVVQASVGGIRLGAKFLAKYSVVICPRKDMIYFEKNIP